jgi:hypothetical protein
VTGWPAVDRFGGEVAGQDAMRWAARRFFSILSGSLQGTFSRCSDTALRRIAAAAGGTGSGPVRTALIDDPIAVAIG